MRRNFFVVFCFLLLCFFPMISSMSSAASNENFEVDAIFSLDEFAKFFQENSIGAFIDLAEKRIAVKGKISDISGLTVSMNTGWMYGRIDFQFSNPNTGIQKIKKGQIGTIIGNFFGYGNKESTLLFGNCFVLNGSPIKKTTPQTASYDDVLAYYYNKSPNAFSGMAKQLVTGVGKALWDTTTSLMGDKKDDEFEFIEKSVVSGMLVLNTDENNSYEKLLEMERRKIKKFLKSMHKAKSSYGSSAQIKRIAASDLQDAYEENYILATNTYGSNKQIIVEGVIDSITGYINYKSGVVRISTGVFSNLPCFFSAESIMGLKKLRPGDEVKIFGQVINHEDNIIIYPAAVFD